MKDYSLLITQVTKNLSLDETGIWISKQSEEVSYPDNENEMCAETEDKSFWFKHRNEISNLS